MKHPLISSRAARFPIIVLALLAIAHPGFAQSASKYLQDAQSYFKQGEYGSALGSLRIYEVESGKKADSEFFSNIEKCRDLLKEIDDAADEKTRWSKLLQIREINPTDKTLKAAFEKAADGGDSYAQYYLGLCYQTGQGVIKDEKEAIELFKLSAANGNYLAERRLSSLKDLL